MTLKEYYRLAGGDYEQTLARMMSEELMRRFLEMFRRDDSFARLIEAMDVGDDEAAFEAVHTLKGIALNVGFIDLGNSASNLTEALRHGKKINTVSLYEQVCKDYTVVKNGFDQLD